MKQTTDELVEKIVAEIGIPLPNYDYEYKKYISAIPSNISFVNGTIGVENADMHDTFRDACSRLVNWYDSLSNGL
jgi:hypothetical protein